MPFLFSNCIWACLTDVLTPQTYIPDFRHMSFTSLFPSFLSICLNQRANEIQLGPSIWNTVGSVNSKLIVKAVISASTVIAQAMAPAAVKITATANSDDVVVPKKSSHVSCEEVWSAADQTTVNRNLKKRQPEKPESHWDEWEKESYRNGVLVCQERPKSSGFDEILYQGIANINHKWKKRIILQSLSSPVFLFF